MESVTLVTSYGSFKFDATLEVQSKSSVTLPSYPTESGVRINDHRVIRPQECRINGIIAAIPLGFTIDSFISRLSRLVSTRPATFLEAVKQLQFTGEPFDVIGRYETLHDMMILEIESVNTAEHEDSLKFDLKLQEFITVDKLIDANQPTVESLASNDPSKSAISADVKTGQVPTTTTINAKAEEVLKYT